MSILHLTYSIYVLAIVLIAILVWIFITDHRIKSFFAGTKANNLEDVLMHISKQMTDVKITQKEINSHLMTVDQRLNKSIRRVESIRFNPFEDSGGNQSFALAFMNDEGDGVIMSSLYARDRMSVFVKPIRKGESEFELSDEEKRVLERAK